MQRTLSDAPMGCRLDAPLDANGCLRLPPQCAPLVGEGCPADAWMSRLALQHLQDGTTPAPAGKPVVLVNIGANKGYAVAAFAAQWLPLRNVDRKHWFWHIKAFAKERSSGTLASLACGVCKACKSTELSVPASLRERLQAEPERRVVMHAIVVVVRRVRPIVGHEARDSTGISHV